jgi:competence protein ComEA
MKFSEWSKIISGTAREHLGVAAASVCLIAAMGLIAAGSFGGCGKPDVAAKADTFPTKSASVTTPTPKPTAKPQAESAIIVYVTGAVKRPGVYTLASDARLYHAIRAAGGFKSNAVTDALNLADRAQDGDQLCIPSRKSVRTAPPAQRTVSAASGYPQAVAPPPMIRKTPTPAPVILPPAIASDEAEPTVTVIATPPPPGRVLGTPTTTPDEPPANIPAEAPPQVAQSAPAAAPGIVSLPASPRKSERTAAKTSTKFKNPGDGIVHINSATAAQLEQLPRCGPAMSAKILAYRAQIGGKFTDIKQLMDVKGCGEKTFAKWEPFLAL